MDHEKGVIRIVQFIVLMPAKFRGLVRDCGLESESANISRGWHCPSLSAHATLVSPWISARAIISRSAKPTR